MRALVTGSDGFVGGWFVRRLNAERWDVDCMDVESGTDCRNAFRDPSFTKRYDLVVHCAAIVGGRRHLESSPLTVATDLGIDAEMFEWAARTRQGRVLYFSSSAAYPMGLQSRWLFESGGAGTLPEDEIDLQLASEPDGMYGWVKLTGERLAAAARTHGVKVTVVRPFSGYGTEQDPTYPFRAFVDRAVAWADPFDVWGDGEQARDFIHIRDIYHACRAILDADTEQPVNLGTGRATTFNELARMVCAARGYTPVIRHQPAEPVGAFYRVADPTLLNTFYTPRVTLEEGISWAVATLIE